MTNFVCKKMGSIALVLILLFTGSCIDTKYTNTEKVLIKWNPQNCGIGRLLLGTSYDFNYFNGTQQMCIVLHRPVLQKVNFHASDYTFKTTLNIT